MSGSIQVLAIRRLDGTSTVTACVDVKIGGVNLKGAKIVEQEGERPWLAMPSIKTERAWYNVVELSKPLWDRATEVVLAAWATHELRDLPARGSRQAHEALDQRADEAAARVFGTKTDRDARIQELADDSDRRGPNKVSF